MEQFDIAIIGAGPAGANFARLADSTQNRILVVYDDSRQKPCGGLLSPDAQRVFASYDISLPREILTSPQIFAVRVLDFDSGISRCYPRHYLNMNRAAFDDWMRSLIPDTVTVVRGRCVCLSDTETGFRLRLADGREYEAARLVGADGASSLVRRTFWTDKKFCFYTAIQQTFAAGDSNPFYSCIFDSKISPACSWILFKDNRIIFGGAFAPANCRAMFEAQKSKLADGSLLPPDKLHSPLSTEACLLRTPVPGKCCTKDNRIFLIGEAAGFLSPSSFEGISYALRSGEMLAASLVDENPARTYQRKTAALRRTLRLKECKSTLLRSVRFRRLIMKSGITAIRTEKGNTDFVGKA